MSRQKHSKVHQKKQDDQQSRFLEPEVESNIRVMSPPPFQLRSSGTGLEEEEEMAGKEIQKMDQGKGHEVPDPPAEEGNGNGAGSGNGNLPDQLKTGMESLSGMDLSHVNVHYNSSKPEQVGAHAYAQGSDIHLGPGQAHHLPHELSHVVQQAEGRVKPTTSVEGMPVNDSPALEAEADDMGQKAMQMKQSSASKESKEKAPESNEGTSQLMQVAQFAITDEKSNAVTAILQSKTDTCWAAAGWSIHQYAGGTAYTTESDFVNAKGSTTAKANYIANTATDIDEIIGSQSVTNRMTSGSDSSSPFAKSTISRHLNGNKVIVANVNNNHYIIICGKRKNNGVYQVQIMDPGYGNTAWVDTSCSTNNTHIDTAGTHSLSVLYYCD